MSADNDNDAIPVANANLASDDDDKSSPSSSTARPRKCYSRFWLDCTGTCRCLPSFRAVDKIYKTDGSFEIKIIDVAASFSPPCAHSKNNSNSNNNNIAAKVVVVLWKLLVVGVQWYTIITRHFMRPHLFFYGYLTSWGLLFSMVYSLFSLANTLLPIANKEETKQTGIDEGIVSLRVRLTWAFFNLGAWLEMVVTVLFWVLVYEGGRVNTYELLAHGIIGALVWIDGLLVNRIPVRLRHWFEMGFPLVVLFSAWTYVQGVLDVEDADGDSDPIYPVLDWEASPWFSLALVSGLVLVFTPMVQLLLVGASLLGRRYVDDDHDHDSSLPNKDAAASELDADADPSSTKSSSAGVGGDVETPVPV